MSDSIDTVLNQFLETIRLHGSDSLQSITFFRTYIHNTELMGLLLLTIENKDLLTGGELQLQLEDWKTARIHAQEIKNQRQARGATDKATKASLKEAGHKCHLCQQPNLTPMGGGERCWWKCACGACSPLGTTWEEAFSGKWTK